MKLFLFLAIALLIGVVFADMYEQSLGCNNRLNEASATRANNNRLFDSQNNARGGKNVGEYTSTAGADNLATSPSLTYNTKAVTATDNAHYPMSFYEGSELTFAWTNQHSCGGLAGTDPQNAYCQVVIQYTCDTDHADPALNVALYNGGNTNTPDAPTTVLSYATTTAANDANNRGRHENERYYAECGTRSRNVGLFLADQALAGKTAIYTRQNANGGRSGLECSEERDYYPYWGPTPWRDVAYLTNEIDNENVAACGLLDASQNVATKYKCTPNATADETLAQQQIYAITESDCQGVGGVWVGYSWNLTKPDCLPAPWTRDNHLGSTRDGYYANYTWTVPTFDQIVSGTQSTDITGDVVKCVARFRYNISTADYDPWSTFNESNGAAASPVTTNPYVAVIPGQTPLKLALNTAQTGRTFQDRTHVFTVRRRPSSLTNKRIVNMITLGKRGNIVEVYPSVEYYWMPTRPELNINDILHVQWTGSNTANNGANGGDGQTGDSGQGTSGTERNNLFLTPSEGVNWPIAYDKSTDHLFDGDHSTCYRPIGATGEIETLTNTTCALILATSGHFTTTDLSDTHAGDWSNQMNNSPPSLINGILIEMKKAGEYPFMCSRNNNFTNRSQKGVIVVKS